MTLNNEKQNISADDNYTDKSEVIKSNLYTEPAVNSVIGIDKDFNLNASDIALSIALRKRCPSRASNASSGRAIGAESLTSA